MMKTYPKLMFVLFALSLVLAPLVSLDVSPARASTIDPTSVNWSVQYMIDQSQTVLGLNQFSGPRDNRGLALSSDGRYLYAGYNNPSSGVSPKQIRKIDTTILDYNDATVAVLTGFRGKAIATDDKGRVYLAEGSDLPTPGIQIYNTDLTSSLYTIPTGSSYGIIKPEGVASSREGGLLVLYVTDRTSKKLTRLEITEGTSDSITSIAKAGLGGSGEIIITNAMDLRGVEVDPEGRIWMADLSGNKVFRVNSDGTGLISIEVYKPIDIGFDDSQAFVTQHTARTITVLKQSDMSVVGSLMPPWSTLRLAPTGQSGYGALSGIAMGSGPYFYVANEAGQTENEKSTYGRCDDQSDLPGGQCTITDLTHDDNEPIFKVQGLDNLGPITSNVNATPNPAAVNSSVILTANVDDTTTGGSNIDLAEYSLDGGPWSPMNALDGGFNDDVSEDVTISFAASSTPSVYNFCVRGTDMHGNVGEPACTLFVVYDPNGGFVTGGGWIWSQAGAYNPDPKLEGKANFGFVSKYKKGASAPDGNTEFQFKAGGLNFQSSSYDWLIVNQAGTNAQFKGRGTINGQGSYQFMLWAGDSSPDTFRIKIWYMDGANEVLIYDNGVAQPIGGGSIVIHKK